MKKNEVVVAKASNAASMSQGYNKREAIIQKKQARLTQSEEKLVKVKEARDLRKKWVKAESLRGRLEPERWPPLIRDTNGSAFYPRERRNIIHKALSSWGGWLIYAAKT